MTNGLKIPMDVDQYTSISELKRMIHYETHVEEHFLLLSFRGSEL
jgi:hypothetical protein